MLIALGKAPKELEHIDMPKKLQECGLLDLVPAAAWPPTQAVSIRHVANTSLYLLTAQIVLGQRTGYHGTQTGEERISTTLCSCGATKVRISLAAKATQASMLHYSCMQVSSCLLRRACGGPVRLCSAWQGKRRSSLVSLACCMGKLHYRSCDAEADVVLGGDISQTAGMLLRAVRIDLASRICVLRSSGAAGCQPSEG